jgi:hypothetical protein
MAVKMDSERPAYLSIPALAAELCCSPEFLYREVRLGRLHAVALGNSAAPRGRMLRVASVEADRWIRERSA